MAAADEIIARVIKDEGGEKDIGDGKGITRYGQTPGWLAEFNLPIPRTPAQAAVNYNVWLARTGLVKVIGPVADSLADIVIDIGVMSSAAKGIKALQAVLHVGIDGVLGPQTLAALAAADRRQLARDTIAWDMVYQGTAITNNPEKLARWAGGWANRMAAHVRRLE